jgi:Ca2+-transporting ATPase
MQSIQPIHVKVNGRARFKIPGLKEEPSVKYYLERRLAEKPDILSVSASSITGNLLVSYNSDNDHRSVAGIIKKIIDTYVSDAGESHWPKKTTIRRSYNKKAKPERTTPKIPTKNSLKTIQKQVPSRQWHQMDRQSLLEELGSSRRDGLPPKVADGLLKQHGPNMLPEATPRTGLRIFLDQMNSLPIYLLGAAAGISIATGGLFDAAVIMGVVVGNAVIGYLTESSAEKTIHSLKRLLRPHTEVIRGGKKQSLSIEEVVMGDILVLKPGIYIAADARIISASHLNIDESMLTGESMPVSKHARPLKRSEIPLADLTNMAYMGTLVTGGQGYAVVVATGVSTEIGRIQIMLNQTRPPETPIERQLGKMGDLLVLMCGGICGVIFLIGMIRGYGFYRMLRMSISLAAAAVPEGLPAAATINFALGITKMRKHHVLIRHLQAVETLGAVQAVCLDKTGTITRNQMTVQRIYSEDRCYEVNEGRFFEEGIEIDHFIQPVLAQLLSTCALCHEIKINGTDSSEPIRLYGSATEKALVQLAIDTGLDAVQARKEYPRLAVNHRSESRLYMSTLHRTPDKERLFCIKGSPGEVLAMCDREAIQGEVIPLTEARRLSIGAENEKMASEALRVLGFACRQFDEGEPVEESGLTWLGLVGMADPIRCSVRHLIDVFHRAGIDTIMITGDQNSTAYTIAEKLNLSGNKPLEMLDSSNLDTMDPQTFEALAKKVHIYSRVSPANKLQIVQALQSVGVTVAMTGDGINDGPALKAADIGIAMGKTGTDVARGVADIVLEEDNLETLALALKDGRAIHDNIRKSVRFFLSTNISEIMMMTAAMGLGIGFPLNVMQLMWINIISDIFPGMVLSMEAAEEDVMRRPPRDADAPIFSRDDFIKMIRESAAITGGALTAYGFGLSRYGPGAGAASLAFQSLTIGQLLHAWSCRSEHSGLFDGQQLPGNPYLNVAIGSSIALQALTMVIPSLRRVLGLTVPALIDLAVITGTSITALILNDAAKGSKP